MANWKLRFVILILLVTFTLFCVEKSHGQSNGRSNRRGPRRDGARRNNRGMSHEVFEAYRAVYQRPTSSTAGPTTTTPTTTTLPSGSVARIPSLPDPEDIQCYVDIAVIELMGGICSTVGRDESTLYICQRGAHIEFQRECEPIFLARQAAAAAINEAVLGQE